MSPKYQTPQSTFAPLTEHRVNDTCLVHQEEVPITFRDFAQTYSWPNMGSLRKLAYESETNGLRDAFIKFKKRRLVLPLTLFRLLKGGKNK